MKTMNNMGKVGRSNSKKGAAGGKGKGGHYKGKPSAAPPSRNRKIEVTFDPADRRDYLTGFSSRKKERRAFGLAMQKVKDRQAKIEERRDHREAQLEKIEDIERNKAALRVGLTGDEGAQSDGDDDSQNEPQHNEKELKTFEDDKTATQFGGFVSVTTTFGLPSDDDDDSIGSKKDFFARESHDANHVDVAQKQAGDVNNYISTVKGTMGNKKKAGSGSGNKGGKKGQHGASSMKGMGNGASLKMAKRTLAKFKAKGGKNSGDNEKDARGGGGRGKKRKGRK